MRPQHSEWFSVYVCLEGVGGGVEQNGAVDLGDGQK